MNKKFLLVNGGFIYPPNHGGLVDAWSRLKILKRMGYKVDLICTAKEQPPKEHIDVVNKYVNKLFIVKRENRLKDLFSIKPLQIKSRDSLKSIQLKEEYEYVFLDGSYVYSILDNPTLKYRYSILHMNNNEILYFKELSKSESSLWRKIYYTLDSYKFRLIDKTIVKRAKNLMFVSIDEFKSYKKMYPNINTYFLPVAVDLNILKQKLDTYNVLFIGALFAPNNKEAIEFYIKKIHPLLMSINNYSLTIAGNSKGEGIQWIKNLSSKYNNIKIVDTPKSLEELYANASIFVNPMLHGAGVKLKTINAIVNGLPVVSTTIGNQGTGLENKKHIYIADDPIEYADCIKKLLIDKTERERLVTESQKYISLYYDQEKILSKYLSEIERS